MTSLERIDERLRVIENDVSAIKAASGKVSLPLPVLIVLWGMLLATVGGVAVVVRVDTQVQDQWRIIGAMQVTLNDHIQQPWHAAAGEKYKAIDDREKALEDRVNKTQERSSQ
jgi:hypothetical protein